MTNVRHTAHNIVSVAEEQTERLILDGTKIGWHLDRVRAWERGERIAPITIDMALTRNFRISDRFNLEARGEAFNLTNSYRAGPVTTARNNAQFGQILTAQDPRIMQVALKLAF